MKDKEKKAPGFNIPSIPGSTVTSLRRRCRSSEICLTSKDSRIPPLSFGGGVKEERGCQGRTRNVGSNSSGRGAAVTSIASLFMEALAFSVGVMTPLLF